MRNLSKRRANSERSWGFSPGRLIDQPVEARVALEMKLLRGSQQRCAHLRKMFGALSMRHREVAEGRTCNPRSFTSSEACRSARGWRSDTVLRGYGVTTTFMTPSRRSPKSV